MQLPAPFIRLPLRVEGERLAAEVAALDPSAWRPHPEGAPGNSAVPLLARHGNPADDSTNGPMAPTPWLAALPYVRQVIAALESTIGRTRLMRIEDDGGLGEHVDVNYYWWHHLRVHVPVVTTPEVRFTVGEHSQHMAAGEVWVFDTWARHGVVNPTATARVHLVVDTVGSDALWQLVDHPDVEPRTIPYEEGATPPIRLETANWPEVMSPDEVESTIRELVRQLPDATSETARAAERLVTGFARDWRDTSAQFGTAPEGADRLRTLARETEVALGGTEGSLLLSNGTELRRAVAQLVLAPSLAAATRWGESVPGAQAGRDAPAPDAEPSVAPLVRARLHGPPRIVDPVFIVSPPRSGSTLLFETLARAPGLTTIGGESHRVIEGIAALTPAAHGWDSNRLDATDAREGVVSHLKDAFVARLRDRDGRRVLGGPVRMLEKTPKNALRVPFLAEAFPDARFVYLYRDPRESISSMLDAWRSGRFVTYSQLPGWHGQPWSLLLVPGWRELDGRTLAEVVTRQWATTTEILLGDLEQLDPDRWCVASYDRLVDDPRAEIAHLCAFLGLPWDDVLDEPLPESAHTLDSPEPEKWRRNAADLQPWMAAIEPGVAAAREVFAAPPRMPRPTSSATLPRVPAAAGIGTDAGRSLDADAVQQLFASSHSGSFAELLDAIGSTIAITTYQAGRVILLRHDGAGLNSHFRQLPQPMGIAFDGRHLAIGTRAEVVVFQNQAALARRLDPPDRHDGVFVTRTRYSTGDIRIHDLAFAGDELWVVNTRFSCLATLDTEHSFVPRWRPPFVSALAPEDRCHLNGLAVADDRPAFVTVLGRTDTPNGWRDDKAHGGAVLDVATGDAVATGLSMPHSPRWHDGRLWVLESGKGSLATVDLESGRIDEVARVPGFARGLAFAGRYAFVGLSRVREHAFDGLPLTRDRSDELCCGVWAIDTETGETVGSLTFDGLVQEIFEVALLTGLRYPEVVEPGASLAETAFVVPDAALPHLA